METVSLLRTPKVVALCGISRGEIHRLRKAGQFPEPISLGKRAIAWPSNLIDAWIAERISKGYGQASAVDRQKMTEKATTARRAKLQREKAERAGAQPLPA